MSYTDEHKATHAFCRQQLYGDEKMDVWTSGLELYHYQKTIAGWHRTTDMLCACPWVCFGPRPSDAKLRLIREVVRIMGIPDMEFGVVKTMPHRRPDRPPNNTFPTFTAMLNGVPLVGSTPVFLADGLTALALRAKFNHP